MVESVEPDVFRKQLRSWLEEHCTDRYRGLHFRGDPDPDWLGRLQEWNRLLADAGWAGLDWPVEFGGRALGLEYQVILAEELDRARAPGTVNPMGIANIAPSIMAFGTDEQKERFLRPMLRGDELWCQGFSEPDAGSDLASLSTRAERSPDGGWVVNGQKVWNTYGNVANWCELLARTDPAAKPHQGISCFLVDMSLPGIEVRPLRTAGGDADFCELFFTDVHLPSDSLLGPEHQGWMVAMATLTFERSGVGNLHIPMRRQIRELIDEVRAAGAADDAVVRQRLARLHTAGEIQRYLSERANARAIAGLPAGPESSLIKMVWSLVSQQLTETAVDALGLAALEGEWGGKFVQSRSNTIAGGTTEVNRNIIGERVLGLPREPRA